MGARGAGAARGRSLYSLLPISEFSAGQRADGRFVVVPGVGGRVASVKRPEPRREEGWPDGGAGLGGNLSRDSVGGKTLLVGRLGVRL